MSRSERWPGMEWEDVRTGTLPATPWRRVIARWRSMGSRWAMLECLHTVEDRGGEAQHCDRCEGADGG